jgi:cytochrome c oxidase subunit 2
MQHFLPEYTGQFWAPAASVMGGQIDAIFFAWCVVLFLLVAPVFAFMTYCAVKYRAGRVADRSHREARNITIEMTWTLVPFTISVVFFFWAGTIYLQEYHPPPNAMIISALGRQWMWKFQHPTGQSEINDLHVPVDTPVRINITSQDVIHSLYIPALRVQEETIPGRTTLLWFKADRVGAYNLYCSELCGADHALMAGRLFVMSPPDYQAWLKQAGTNEKLASGGKRLFDSYGCGGCHVQGSAVRAPVLNGIFGQVVALRDGGTVPVDEAFIRDSILEPQKVAVAGYQQVMPSFAGAISQDDLARLVAYIKSLGEGSQQTP